MQVRVARAFAPAVISTFFVIQDEALHTRPFDFQRVGATGGGFTLSRGVFTGASVAEGGPPAIIVRVNGNARFRATTTKKAVELLLGATGKARTRVELEQEVQVPIGAGFGTSSASALSAVMAVASALGLDLSKEKIASYAHQADILCHTGLGTVSSTYDHVGAGVIIRAGGPGVALVKSVKVPPGVRVVTVSLSALRGKRSLLSSPKLRERVNALGREALEAASSDLSFESLLAAGQKFAERLGLETPTIKRLIATSMEEGALAASQNMVGNSMHAIVLAKGLERLVASLSSVSPSARIDVFRIGGGSARVVRARTREIHHA